MKLDNLNFEKMEVSMELKSTPKFRKDLYAALNGYHRPSGIKRTRKRGIEKAKLMNMTPRQRRYYDYQKAIRKGFAYLGIAFAKISKQVMKK